MTAVAVETETVQKPRVTGRAIPLSRICTVELRKMFDTRSGFWLMASVAVTSLLATGAVILFAPDDQLTYATFGSAIGFPIAVILPMIAILSVTSEWSQRSGLTTFTLVPNRSRVILAKAIASVGVGVVSMLVAIAIGALGNVVGTAITGTATVWDVSFAQSVNLVIGNVLGLMTGFMLGLLIRSSAGAIVAYFVYSLILPGAFGFLASVQVWFRDLQPWVDVNFAQGQLFQFDTAVTGEQWANLAVTEATWLLLPLAVGLVLLRRSEIK